MITCWWEWRADGGRENPQQVTATRSRWWRADGGRENQPTGHNNLLVEVESRWRQEEPPTSHGDLLAVMEDRWRLDPQRVVGGGGGQMEAGRTNQRVTATRWW